MKCLHVQVCCIHKYIISYYHTGTIRHSLGVDVISKVQTLALPTRLKHYLVYDTERHLDLADLNDVVHELDVGL